MPQSSASICWLSVETLPLSAEEEALTQSLDQWSLSHRHRTLLDTLESELGSATARRLQAIPLFHQTLTDCWETLQADRPIAPPACAACN